MNKLLKSSLLLTLALPVLAGCQGGGASYKETRSEEEVVTDLANQALAELGVAYASFSSTGLSYGKNELITSLNQKVWEGDEVGLDFTVSYTLTAQETFTKEFVTLTQEGGEAYLTSELVTLDDLGEYGKALGGAAYTLTANLTFKGYGENFKVKGLKTTETYVNQKVGTKGWNAVDKVAVTAPNFATLKGTTKNKDYVLFTGTFYAWYENTYDSLYSGAFITSGDEGIMIYAGSITKDFFDAETKEAIILPGDVVTVFGQVSPYNGLYEVKPVSVTKETDEGIITSVPTTTSKTLTVPEINEGLTANTGAMVTVNGLKIKSKPDTLKVGSHWTIVAEDASGNELTIYVNYHIGEEAQTAIKDVIDGLGTSSFTLNGVWSAYNKMQISPVNTATSSAATAFVKE